VVRELVEKAARVVPEPDWRVHYALFARSGFADAAREEPAAHDALLVDLATLDDDLLPSIVFFGSCGIERVG
jgi:hypothetical protein